MNITFITLSFPFPNEGSLPGIETSVKNLALYLKKLGHNIKIVTTYWNRGKKFGNYKDIPILRVLDSKALLGKIGTLFLLHYYTFGLQIIRKKNFTFYHDSDVLIFPLAVGFTRYFKNNKIPIISIFHHYESPEKLRDYIYLPFYKYLAKKQFKIHKNIITRSQAAKKDLLRFYGKQEENYVKIIPDGINLKNFNPKNKDPQIQKKYGNNVLLYVGPFYNRKKIPILLKAMPIIIKKIPDIHLILIGKGEVWNECKVLAKLLGIQRHTSFLGFVEEESLRKFYASSKIFVFPSEIEGFGQVILEALASGIPVICANKPPMSKVIENGGKTFFLNNPQDLSKKIIELLNDKEERLTLSRNALMVAKKYQWKQIANKYISFIKEIKRK